MQSNQKLVRFLSEYKCLLEVLVFRLYNGVSC
jgi:hypothetical protein